MSATEPAGAKAGRAAYLSSAEEVLSTRAPGVRRAALIGGLASASGIDAFGATDASEFTDARQVIEQRIQVVSKPLVKCGFVFVIGCHRLLPRCYRQS